MDQGCGEGIMQHSRIIDVECERCSCSAGCGAALSQLIEYGHRRCDVQRFSCVLEILFCLTDILLNSLALSVRYRYLDTDTVSRYFSCDTVPVSITDARTRTRAQQTQNRTICSPGNTDFYGI